MAQAMGRLRVLLYYLMVWLMAGFKHFFEPPPIQGRELTLRGIGYRQPMVPGIVNRPAGTGDYFFLYCYQDVYLRLSEEDVRHKPHTMIAWDPTQGHYYGHPKQRWIHSWLHCDGTFVARWFRETRMPRNSPFVVSDPTLIEEPLLQCHRELTRTGAPDKRILGNLLENLIRGLAREAQRTPSSQVIPAPFVEIRHYMQAHFEKPFRLEDLARRVHISVPHFCSEFKRYFNVAPIEYLIHLRLQRAVYLLRNRNMRIGEIAEGSGYTDVYHFSKLFKKHYGVSPKGMRARLLAGQDA